MDLEEIIKFQKFINKTYEIGDRIKINKIVGKKSQIETNIIGTILNIGVSQYGNIVYILTIEGLNGKYFAFHSYISGYPLTCPCCNELKIVQGTHPKKEDLLKVDLENGE